MQFYAKRYRGERMTVKTNSTTESNPCRGRVWGQLPQRGDLVHDRCFARLLMKLIAMRLQPVSLDIAFSCKSKNYMFY